jgi:N6-adenosine-specific RNA methylase IME4
MPPAKANRGTGDPAARQGFVCEKDGQALSLIATRPINDIIVGERHRKDLGDIAGFAARIGKDGLLNPITIKPDGRLIAGERRLRAVKLLGWSEIPVHVVDTGTVVSGEFAENVDRKDFTLSELVAIGEDVEAEERERAKERQGSRTDLVATCHEVGFGRTRDRTAQKLGISGHTFERAKEVVEAGRAEPERFGPFVEQMDRTGRANGVFKRLKIIRQAELIRAEPPALPWKGPYRVIVADPPWQTRVRADDPSSRRTIPYAGQSMDDIRRLDVASIAHDDCVLWLWATNADIREAFTVLDAWKFELKTILTWVKHKMGTGDWLRGQTEHCLMAVRGKPTVTLSNQSTVLHAPARGHSQKPHEFYHLVESLCPAPRYADLFSRCRHNERWDVHGDEAPAAPEPTPAAPEPPSPPGTAPTVNGGGRP